MKNKDFLAEIRELNVTELKAKSAELRGEALKTRIRKVSGQLNTPHIATDLRKKIAKIETVIVEKSK